MRTRTCISLIAILLFRAAGFAQITYDIPLIRPLDYGRDTVTIRIIGDVMMHEKQLSHPHKTFLENISGSLRSADLAVANMEFSLGGRPYSGYPAFSAPDSYAGYVAGCGVDIFLTANNHTLDRGAKGLERTLDIYAAMRDSVLFTGAARNAAEMERNNPLTLVCKGIRFSLINFTYGTNAPQTGTWPKVYRTDGEELEEAFRKARERESDFIIALPHWGNEYETSHSRQQEETAERLVGMGADVIVGSHPHVVQDTSHIAGVPVIYSVGNAVSNMSAKNTRLELMVTLRFTTDRADGKKEMLEPELRYMWCTLPGKLTDSYATIFIDEWEGRRDRWKVPQDYDNMIATLKENL